jgi:serine/threonine protein phosphatase PrpC
VANVGDSRAFLARTDSETGKVIPVPLTFEHTLDKEQEITRVKAKGGKVYAYEGKPSDPKKGSDSTTRRNSVRRNSVRRNSVKKTAPLRIWYKVGSSSKESGPGRRLSLTRRGSVCNTIGLAMTRSLGDKLAHDTSGVISEPSVFEFEINLDLDHYIVIGSDGVWDMTTYAEAMASVEEDIANNGKSWSPQRAAELLVENARLKWENQSRSIDDITCCIIKLNM